MSIAGRCIARSTSSGTVVGPGIARNSRPARTLICHCLRFCPFHRTIGKERGHANSGTLAFTMNSSGFLPDLSHRAVANLLSPLAHLIGPDLEADERVGTERIGDRHIGGVAPGGEQCGR